MDGSTATEPSLSRPTRWWLDRSVRTKGILVVTVPLACLLVVVTASLVLQVRQRNERTLAIKVSALASAARPLLIDALDAETGVRGYAATQDPSLLEPYDAALARLPADLATLRAAAAGTGQQAPAERIAGTAADVFALLDRLHTDAAAGAPRTALEPRLMAGKEVMDRLRGQVADFLAEPTAAAARLRDAVTRLQTDIEVLDLTGLVLGLLVGLVGIALFSAGIAGRLAVAADNADRLGRGAPLVRTVPSGDELGRVAAALGRAEGLLASRHAELAAARDEAVRANEVKTSFLSRTSHELRTPLNAILGFAQLLQRSGLGERDSASAAQIRAAGQHLLALINELIDIARIESGDLTLSTEAVGLAAITDEVATLLRPLAAARAVTVTDGSGSAVLAAIADHQRLRQILINLVSNAVKYNRDGGSVRIGSRADGEDWVEIDVTDTGPGLSEAEQLLVFQPFERLHVQDYDIEGTGIGLPLTRSLTEVMGGALSVASSPGSGSTFTVRLPRGPDLRPTVAVPVGPPAARPRARDGRAALEVVSIEDNIANSRLIAQFFAGRPDAGLRATPLGRIGIELAREHRPDVVLLDLHLPDLRGDEVLHELRADPATAGIPVLVLSADASADTAKRLLAGGAFRYLAKPVDFDELDDALDEAAALARARSQGTQT